MHSLRKSVVLVLTIGLTVLGVHTAQAREADTVSADEVTQALGSVPDLLTASDQVDARVDGDSATVTQVADITIEVPKDSSEGVNLDVAAGNSRLTVELPDAEAAETGIEVAAGVTAYPGNQGFANAVQTTEDGSLRMLTVIDSRRASTSYSYKIDVPAGGLIRRIKGGGAAVLDADRNVVALIATPWARDAHGKAVRTRFTVHGSTLTQHVAHRQRGVVYPVVADPVILGVFLSWWTVTRIVACAGGGIWGWISAGGNTWDQRAYQAFMGCVQALGLAYLFRRR
jgi:hypothetical protein